MSKILVSVDDKLLARIDRAAKAAGLSRSAYLARLAARDLGADRGPGAGPQARRAISRLEKLFDARPAEEEATAAGSGGAGLSLTEVVIDASVVLKWFAAEQRGSAEARELRSEYQAGHLFVAVPALLFSSS